MSTAEKRRLTLAEYLAMEVASEGRHEFFDGEMFAMSGGSYWHNLVKDNLARALGNRLAEVLSDSTEKYDRGVKFGHYRQLPTVQEYLVLAQDRISVERYRRQTAGEPGSWLLTAGTDPAGMVEFESLGIAVPVAEIYAGVEFPPPA